MTHVIPLQKQPAKPADAAKNSTSDHQHGEISEDTQIAAPHEVDIPLPPSPQEQIAVPASINGRDLSKGRP